MNSEIFDAKRNNNDEVSIIPKYVITNKTYWYRWVIVSLLNAIIILITIPLLSFKDITDAVFLIYILYGFLIFFPLTIGFLRKKTSRIFLISKSNPNLQPKDTNQLIYCSQMRNLKIFSKTFKLNEIKRFEVIQRMRRNNLRWYCALVFKSGEYLTITTTLDESLTFHYAKELNKFLALNSSLDKKLITQELVPYTPIKEQKKIKLVRSLKILVFIITMILLGILSIIFLIGNIEILPGLIILSISLCINVLLIIALNGATFDSL